MIVGIRDVQISVLVHGDSGWGAELSVFHTFLPEYLGNQVRRRDRHDLLRLGTFALLRHHGDDIVITGPIRQIVVDEGRMRAFDTGPFFLRYTDDGLEIFRLAIGRVNSENLIWTPFGGHEI